MRGGPRRMSDAVAVTERVNPASRVRCGAARRQMSTVTCRAARECRPDPRSMVRAPSRPMVRERMTDPSCSRRVA